MNYKRFLLRKSLCIKRFLVILHKESVNFFLKNKFL